ncbi:hypothetical protein E1B28_006823 [Marasmius oreades]|uniref:Uncharacterized protein n=1 Tax=Marasmius oreades TaxID=181124 RepID=A0A9P8ABJ7_9AGAR|nr:uncharacterized protein E1B28_006823 [Marasmius oreades]KAG7096150.1 hypothetical protein E1B28_006823 [Marasmius oreades]
MNALQFATPSLKAEVLRLLPFRTWLPLQAEVHKSEDCQLLMNAKHLEGVHSNFIKFVAQTPPNSSTSRFQIQALSPENSDQEKSDLNSNLSGSELVGGIFNEDQSIDMVTDARKDKKLLKTDPTVMKAKQSLPENLVLERLVSADINGIDENESEMTLRGSSCKTITIKDLPFPSDYTQVYQKKWEQRFMAHILHFAKTQELQFGIGNRPELASFVTSTWKQVFPELKIHGKDINILKFVQVELRNYRSNVGKEALSIVEKKLSRVEGATVERAEWIAEQLKND